MATVICLDDYHSLDRKGRAEKGVTALAPEAQNFDLMFDQVGVCWRCGGVWRRVVACGGAWWRPGRVWGQLCVTRRRWQAAAAQLGMQ
jgi:hypothetical protein